MDKCEIIFKNRPKVKLKIQISLNLGILECSRFSGTSISALVVGREIGNNVCRALFLYISFYFFWFMLVPSVLPRIPTSLDAVLWLPPDRFRYVAD